MKNKKTAIVDKSNINLSATNAVRSDPLQRIEMIAIAAYFRSEKRESSSKDEQADWLESEAEIDRHLNSFSS